MPIACATRWVRDIPNVPDRLSAVNDRDARFRNAGRIALPRSAAGRAEDLKRVHRAGYVDLIFENAPTEGYVQLDPDTAMNP